MSKSQNIYANDAFFEGYKALRDGDCNFNDLLEQPAMADLLPDLEGKAVLDLGCGYGHNCIGFIKLAASLKNWNGIKFWHKCGFDKMTMVDISNDYGCIELEKEI